METNMTFNRFAVLASLVLATACSSKAACEDYVAALGTCASEAAGGDTGFTVDSDGVCDTDAAAEYKKADYNCATDALEGGDCATPEGYLAAVAEAAACFTAE